MNADAPDSNALEDVLASADGLAHAPLRDRLAWLERAALAAERADLGERGVQGALSLRAALGAIVRFSQSEQSHDALAELDVVVRTLLSRAQLAFTSALADQYETLASDRGAGTLRETCRELADVYRELARAVRRGEPVSSETMQRVQRVRESWEQARRADPPS
jgi:hypothetical protein